MADPNVASNLRKKRPSSSKVLKDGASRAPGFLKATGGAPGPKKPGMQFKTPTGERPGKRLTVPKGTRKPLPNKPARAMPAPPPRGRVGAVANKVKRSIPVQRRREGAIGTPLTKLKGPNRAQRRNAVARSSAAAKVRGQGPKPHPTRAAIWRRQHPNMAGEANPYGKDAVAAGKARLPKGGAPKSKRPKAATRRHLPTPPKRAAK